ncbi:hypothetical protein G9A89_006730 [Geosiphon pyriformis]|nr:hypothetical protein G9A89_006730 [Geosiphon pyriformis]
MPRGRSLEPHFYLYHNPTIPAVAHFEPSDSLDVATLITSLEYMYNFRRIRKIALSSRRAVLFLRFEDYPCSK